MLKLHLRSEYAHALNLARRARRRGDIAAAEQWLKHAERHLLLEKRFDDMLNASIARDAELRVTGASEAEESEQQQRARNYLKLCDELDMISKSDLSNPPAFIDEDLTYP